MEQPGRSQQSEEIISCFPIETCNALYLLKSTFFKPKLNFESKGVYFLEFR
jgi:hypothetical protein